MLRRGSTQDRCNTAVGRTPGIPDLGDVQETAKRFLDRQQSKTLITKLY